MTEKKTLTIRDHLQSDAFKASLEQVLPKHVTPDRMARMAIAAMTRTPKLAQCDQKSFFRCMMDLSQWGLEPDGRRAHLIPFGKECTLIIDYKGFCELIYRSGFVSRIHADVVHEGDDFEWNKGEVIRHVPWFLRRDKAKPDEAGEVIAAYCECKMKDGAEKADVMSFAEIEKIRNRSKAKNSGPWVTDWNEMAKKTVFRRLSKWLPLSAEIRDAIEVDDSHSGIIDAPAAHPLLSSDDLMSRIEGAAPEPQDNSERYKSFVDQITNAKTAAEVTDISEHINADQDITDGEFARLSEVLSERGVQIAEQVTE